MLLPSGLGLVISGILSGITVNVAAVNFLHLEEPSPLLETEIKKFWDLETILITAQQEELWHAKDMAVLQTFQGSFRIDESRRVVSLPKEIVTLPSNRQNEENQF